MVSDDVGQGQCPERKLGELVTAMGSGSAHAMHDLDTLVETYPSDARLRFLRGSMLAGKQNYLAARSEMRRALDLAPNYTIARFQLGLLTLTCGEPYAALEVWGPLHSLPQDSFLLLFVRGLSHLIKDEFADAIALLEEGISRNRENIPMNRDMQMVIDEARDKMRGASSRGASSVDMLLQQAALKARKH
jgi:tetratricopeptide (TPR) repeat protein